MSIFAQNEWRVESGSPIPGNIVSPCETLRWQDPATPLRIVQVGDQSDGVLRLRMGTDIVVDIHSKGRIVARPRFGLPQITTDHFLADQVFPRLVAHQGALVVHAGAIKVGRGAVMLLGNSGLGKSTLSASFDQAGFDLIGDDAMVMSSIDGRSHVRAVYPSLRLLPDSIAALMPGAATAGPIAHYSTKHRIDVAGARDAAGGPLPVRAIFTLARTTGDERIVIRPLPMAESCMTLIENSFALDPSDMLQAKARLTDASAIARQVPAFEIAYPRDYGRLPAVRQAILDQLDDGEMA